MGTRRWRWDHWLVAGPIAGGLALGVTAPVLFWVDSRVDELPPGLSYDLGAAVVGAVVGAMLGAMAGLAAGVVCAVITAPVEWLRRPSRRFYTWLPVAVTVALGAVVGAFGHGANSGVGLVLFPVVPICVSAFAAYWAGAWVWSKG